VKALLYHQAAQEAWDLDMASAWWDGQDKASYWKPRYPLLGFSASATGLTADQVRQAAWTVAGSAYAEARKAATGK